MLIIAAGHRQSDGERAPADARGRRTRATHGAAVCDEPRAGSDARHRRTWPRGGPACGRGVPVQGRGAAAGSPTASCAIRPTRRSRDPFAARIWRWRSGWPITAARRGSAPTPCPAAPGLYVPLGDERRTAGRAGGAAEQSAARAAARAAPSARDLCRPDRHWHWSARRLAEVAEAARLAAERESLRNTLLASISHDLRTPLAVIAGAGSTLAEHGATLDEATRVRWRAPSRPRRARCRSWSRTCSI